MMLHMYGCTMQIAPRYNNKTTVILIRLFPSLRHHYSRQHILTERCNPSQDGKSVIFAYSHIRSGFTWQLISYMQGNMVFTCNSVVKHRYLFLNIAHQKLHLLIPVWQMSSTSTEMDVSRFLRLSLQGHWNKIKLRHFDPRFLALAVLYHNPKLASRYVIEL